jgi:tetratricopeptide (TPR) repeat protein
MTHRTNVTSSSSQSAHRVASPESAKAGDGPRFDLRIDAKRVSLVLRAPLRLAPFRVKALELEIERVRFPIAVGGGATRFRHRQTSLRAGAVELDFRAVVEWAALRGVQLELHPDPHDPRRVHAGLTDDTGWLHVAVRLLASPVGFELRLESAESFACPGYSSWQRARDAVERLGFRFDDTRGVFRYDDALPGVLRLSLVRYGWRLPSSADIEIAWAVSAPGHFSVTAERDAASREVDVTEREGAREAVALFEAIQTRALLLPPSLSPLHRAQLAFERGDVAGTLAEDTLSSRVLALRVALASGEAKASLSAFDALRGRVPVATLLAEAAFETAKVVRSVSPRRALDLAIEAAFSRAHRAELLSFAFELAREIDDAGAVEQLVPRVEMLLSREPERIEWIEPIVVSCVAVGRPELAMRFLDEQLTRAEPRAETALAAAELALAMGDAPRAVSLAERAFFLAVGADAAEPMRAACLTAASALVDLGDAQGAVSRLRDAVRILPSDAELWSLLALALARSGDRRAAAKAFARLLELPADPRSVSALSEAVDLHLEAGEAATARAFVEHLERADSRAAALPVLKARLARAAARATLGASNPYDLDLDTLDELALDAGLADELVAALLAMLDEPSVERDKVRAASLVRVARAAANNAGSSRLSEKVSHRLARTPELIDDVALVEALESVTSSSASRIALADRASHLHRDSGDFGAAARAMARSAVLRKDAGRLRAAVELAEEGAAWSDAVAIVLEALELVRDEGPARKAWRERLDRLETLRTHAD